MRRLFFMFAAAIGLLASCSSDEIATGQDGEKSVVTITATLPAGFATRANISDGTTANKLSYAVYKKGSTTAIFSGKRAVQFSNREATLPLTLAIGESYDFVFWADADDAPYKFDEGAQTITVTYNGKSNDEKRDAFFGQIKGFKVTERATSLSATLYRPFSQINVATDDFDAAVTAGVTVTSSSFTVKGGIYNTLNLLDGSVSGEETSGVTFTDNAIPTEKITIDGKQYKWLTMNYMLVDQAKALTTVTGTFNNAATPVLSLTSVPVQRNYRTNIYGSLLTSAATAKILIDQNFQRPDYNVLLTWDGTTVTTPQSDANGIVHLTTAAEVAGLAAAVNAGDTYAGKTITLDADMNLADKAFTPIAAEKANAFAGTFDGQGHSIAGLKATSADKTHPAGLIAFLAGEVKNVNVAAADLSGVIAGVVGETTAATAKITDVIVTSGTVTASTAAAGVLARGYAGGTLTRCVNNATVTGTNNAAKVGGIAAIVSNPGETTFTDCTNNGRVTAVEQSAGGIVGMANHKVTLSGCTNTAAVTNNATSGSAGNAGGLVGSMSSPNPATVTGGLVATNCSNTAKVVGLNAGGLVGSCDQTFETLMTSCTNSGEVVAIKHAGGIVWKLGYGTLTSCDNNASVTATDTQSGIAGGVVADFSARAKIVNCAGGSAAITARFAGRIAGELHNSGDGRGSFPTGYDPELTVAANSDSYAGIATFGVQDYSQDGNQRSTVIVKGGTVHGSWLVYRYVNAAPHRVKLEGSATWDKFPGSTATTYELTPIVGATTPTVWDGTTQQTWRVATN